MPAPNFSSTLDDIDKLARAVDRAAPRYANFDHFHYKRVAGHVRALKDRITNASCDVDHGGQPVIAVEFLEQALTKAIEMPTFQQYSDNQARTQVGNETIGERPAYKHHVMHSHGGCLLTCSSYE